MAYDKNMNELKDYTFEIARKCVVEGRDEFMFFYKGQIFSIGICNDKIMRLWDKDKKINKSNPEWFCYNDTKDELVIVSEKETLLDSVRIELNSLKNIWDQIIIL